MKNSTKKFDGLQSKSLVSNALIGANIVNGYLVKVGNSEHA